MTEKDNVANEIIKRNSLYSGGVGLIALPIVNVAGVMALQIKMLRELAAAYDVPFEQERVKGVLSTLLTSLLGTEVGYGFVGTAAGLPLVGPVLSVLTVPFFAGAATYATGKVFMQHFASGGTFLDFDPEKVRGYFREQFASGKKATA